MDDTHHLVVPFDRDPYGRLKPGDPQAVKSAERAKMCAVSLALLHAGAVAFSRTGDASIGEFSDAEITAQFGEVDLNVLSV